MDLCITLKVAKNRFTLNQVNHILDTNALIILYKDVCFTIFDVLFGCVGQYL